MAQTDPRIAFFDTLAPGWDNDQPPAAEIFGRLDALRSTLELRPGLDVLEVGCGTGLVTEWLIKQVSPGRVTSIDFSPAMIAAAAQRGLVADFRCVDVCDGELIRGTYDLVWCMHCFPHFRDQRRALANLAATLRPGGRLIVLHLSSWQAINAFHADLAEPVNQDMLPTPAEWRELLSAGGLRQTRLIERDDLFFLDTRRAT